MDDGDWKTALRFQIEQLAQKNDGHKKAETPSIRIRTDEMNEKILRLRELFFSDPPEAAKFFLECSFYADQTERQLNRNPPLPLKKQARSVKNSTRFNAVVSTIQGTSRLPPSESQETVPERPKWRSQWSHNQRDDSIAQQRAERRELWKSQKDFFLSCLGFMVGVGHVVRFPAKVYQHGGGVFFIPYLFCLIFFGLPLVFLHLSIGQYSGQAANSAFKKMMPIASGVGWALVVVAIPVAIYYNMLVAWALYYLYHSIKGFFLTNGLPWDVCNPNWVLDSPCCNLHDLSTCLQGNSTITAPEAFFHAQVLSLSPAGDFSLGPLQPHLVLSLACAWFLIFFGVFKGIGSIGSTMHITATVPYLLLTILLLRGISLPGADVGLSFLFGVKTEKLWNWNIWKSAAEQVFYELGIDAGPLVSMAAFSRFRNNVYRDSALLVFFDGLTSTLAGMVIFSFIGFLATVSNSNVDDVLQHDPLYLSFTVYPGVTSYMYWGALWATLFFGMLVLAAIDAEFAWLEMIASALMNHFSTKNKAFEYRILAFLCFMGFLCGLPFCAQGGIFIFHAIENLNANWNSFSLALFTVCIVSYCYGIDKYLKTISTMLRIPQIPLAKAKNTKDKIISIFGPGGVYIRFSLSVVCPVVISMLLITSMFGYQRISFGARLIPIEYELTAWVVMVGPLIVIPIVACAQMKQMRKEGKTLSSLFDTCEWGEDRNSEDSGNTEDIAVVPWRRRTTIAIPGRDNTYMYIDSRGPTIRTRVFPMSGGTTLQDPYGWSAGRIRECQADSVSSNIDELTNSEDDDSFSPISMKQSEMDRPIALFGAPPINPFTVSDANTIKELPYRRREQQQKQQQNCYEMTETMKAQSPTVSEPQLPKSLPPPPPPRPSRSLPPVGMHPSPSQRSLATRSASLDQNVDSRSSSPSSSSSTSSQEEDDGRGIRCQRRTVIRRGESEGGESALTSGMTPRERSISSVAIFGEDDSQSKPACQKVSKLMRPKPIQGPSK